MIEVERLTQRYGSLVAVRDATFRVEKGEVVGFLGPNGAGKTTTLRVLASFLPPTEGRVRVAGCDVEKDSLGARRALGYLPEQNPLWREMTARAFLHFVGRVRGLDRPARASAIGRVADRCGLAAILDRPIADLSKGNRQRAGLAAALLHDPPILVLDEPTSGLDPRQVQDIRQLVREIGRTRTVIFSTHVLQEVEATCRRAIVIHEGRIVADETIDGLKRRAAHGAVRVRVRAEVAAADVSRALARVPGVAEVRAPGETTFEVVPTDPAADLAPDLFRAAVAGGWVLHELAPVEATLEQVFLALTGRP